MIVIGLQITPLERIGPQAKSDEIGLTIAPPMYISSASLRRESLSVTFFSDIVFFSLVCLFFDYFLNGLHDLWDAMHSAEIVRTKPQP